MNRVSHSRMVVYLDRNEAHFFDPKQNKVFVIAFDKKICDSLQVLNISEYKKLIGKFIAKYDIKKQKVLVILKSSVYVSKTPEEILNAHEKNSTDLKLSTVEAIDFATKLLRESMPFTNVYVKMIHQQKKTVLVAINRDFFEPLLDALNELGFETTTLVPEEILPVQLLRDGFNAKTGAQLGKMVQTLEANDLLEDERKVRQFITTKATPAEKKRTWLLFLFFVFLILILIGVYWFVSEQDKKELEEKRARLKQSNVEKTIIPMDLNQTQQLLESSSSADNPMQIDELVQNSTDSAQTTEIINATRSSQLNVDLLATRSSSLNESNPTVETPPPLLE